jgi:O-antigen ligase
LSIRDAAIKEVYVARFVQATRAFTCWLLFVVLMGAVLAAGANQPVAWVLMCMAVFLLFCVTLLLDALQDRPPAINALWLPAVLYGGALAWGALQMAHSLFPADWAHPVWALVPEVEGAVSADPSAGLHVLMRLACYGMIFWMAVRSAENPRTAYNLLRAFAIFSMALAAYGFYASQSGSNPLLGTEGASRVTASFVNRNHYATFAGFGLVACTALLLRSTSSWERQRRKALASLLESLFAGGWVWILGILLCGGALMFSESRGGALAALIGVLTLLTTLRLRGGRAAVGPVLIIASIVGLVLLSASTATVTRMMASSGEEARFAVYPQIWAQALERPWLGHGLGAFEDVFRAALPVEAAFGAWDKAHNSYLENALELGLPAAAAFYLALGLIGWQLLQGLLQRRRDRAPVAVAFACFLLAGFHAFFDFSLQMPALAGFFAWLIGIGYVQSVSSGQLSGDPT